MTYKEILNYADEMLNFTLFNINTNAISIAELFKFMVILSVFLLFSRMLKKRFLKNLLNRFHIEEGLQFTLIRISQYIIISIGFIVAFQFIGVDLSALAVIFGFLSVGIGFGLQNIASNFISGLILLFERPIRVGDRVTVSDKEGDVMNINIRSTTIRSLNNISIIVPNSEFISSPVINWSHGDTRIRVDLDVGVSYNSNLEVVLRSLKEVALENKEVLKTPEPEVHFVSFGDSSWDMRLRVWTDNPKRYYYLRSDINCAIVKKFRENNIEIPFPQRDLHVRSTVPLPTRVDKE
ncbi:MAG: mechanosensitive ion channel protein MscS [Melioribacteraceae bacterium]|nr:MAG: mechanosensitive ion channel protein MscS [Melioribacteraceae bacterium]